MKRLLLIILFFLPIFAIAQRVEVVAVNNESGVVRRSTTAMADENLYLAIFAYGLPREIVRTNQEMRDAIYGGSVYSSISTPLASTTGEGYVGALGVTQRHHTTKGIDEPITPTGGEPTGVGYDVNHKISFCYLIAPYNVKTNGDPDTASSETLTWAVASGWDATIDSEIGHTGSGDVSGDGIGVGKGKSTLNTTPTGCAAYKGLGGKDLNGTWRLPTQRESQVMFTIMEQAMGLVSTYGVQNAITPGVFWTSTELFASGFAWKAWSNNSTSGSVSNIEKNLQPHFARCVRDVYFKVNEVTVKK